MEVTDIQAHLRLLDLRATKEKKIITVGIVSEREDSYRTIILPDGCLTPMQSVLVDYNHNRISTGARIVDKGVQEIKVEINGVPKSIRSRVVDVEVYRDSRMWTRQNEKDPADKVPSLYDNVENGRIGWVSVDFTPVTIDEDYDKDGNLKREVYKEWRLNYLSLLDVKPGQDDSFFLNVRSNNNFLNQKNMDGIEKLQQENAELKIRIADLESKQRTAEDDEKVRTLETENTELKTEKAELENQKRELEEKITKLTNSPDSNNIRSSETEGGADMGADTQKGGGDKELDEIEKQRQDVLYARGII